MPEFELNQQSQSEISDFVEEWFDLAPEIMGISESIAGCEVTNVDTYGVGVGVFPRYVTVRIYEYTVQAFYRGFPTIILNDLVTVLHFREGNRYEVIGISGSTGSSTVLGGTGAVTQVAYWTAVTTLAGDAGFTYNAATDTFTLAGGIILTGSASAVITVNDNVANALTLVDAGATEYLRIISTNAQPVIRFNDGGADIDFHVEAVGVADAIQVQGSDGQITLGALTLGYVRSNAGGVLSVALEVPLIDLGGYTQGDLIYGGAADWQDLAIGTQHQLLKVNVAGTEPIWASFDWDEISVAAAADMVHDHSAAGEGGEVPLASLGDYTLGDVIIGGAVDWDDLAIGAAAEVLTVVAGSPAWAAAGGGVAIEELHEHAWQEDWTAACNGVKINFITANEFSERTTLIMLNGSLQRAGTDYTEDVLFNSVTFTAAPIGGDELITAYELA